MAGFCAERTRNSFDGIRSYFCMKTIFISGVNGFIGAHLARFLIEKGYGVSGIGKEERCEIAGVRYGQCNVLKKDCVAEYSGGSDVFVHLAAITSHEEIIADPDGMLKMSWSGTMSMLHAFVENGGNHFIYASTGKVYGDFDTLPLGEDTPTRPKSILGKSKYMCERLIDFFANLHQDYTFSILRIFNVYGEGQKDQFLIPTIIKQLNGGNDEVHLGDVGAKRDYLYVGDLVSAVESIMRSNRKRGICVFNVGSGEAYSAKDIVGMVSEILGKEIRIIGDRRRRRPDELDVEYCSNKKLKTLGWAPRFNLREGLTQLLKKGG